MSELRWRHATPYNFSVTTDFLIYRSGYNLENELSPTFRNTTFERLENAIMVSRVSGSQRSPHFKQKTVEADIIHILDMYIKPLIGMIGLVGNILIILATLNRRNSGSTSSRYLGILGVADFIQNIAIMNRWLFTIYLRIGMS